MKISNILRTAFILLTVLLFGFVSFLFVSGTKCFAVQSESMAPALHRGDVVFVRKVDFGALGEGDIISAHFPEGEGVFTHRIISVNTADQSVVTRGDANLSKDPVATKSENIIGKFWFSVPFVGFLSLYLQSKALIFILLGMAFVLILVRTILQIRKKTDE